eukprot:Anaeramoba_ignava/a616399_95.p1 GENE.a616399_95~~a616399_95.p1  ORF type:complete len:186 (+),score=-4.35 a616399_95:506-1063(+)
MNTILICLIVCSVYSIIIYAVLSYRISKKVDNKTFLKEVRDEINSLVTQINETSDRNVLLLENRLERLSNLISISDTAISRLKNLNRESEEKKDIKVDNGRGESSSSDPQISVVNTIPENLNQIEIDEVIPDTSEQSPEIEVNESLSRKDRILLLHRQGISPSVIATQTKATIGEVELIISLDRG